MKDQGGGTMLYEEVIQNFAKRTRKNLSIIEKLERDGEEVFEITQLVNSCLGLLVFPQQAFMDRIPKTPISELAEQGWPIPKVVDDFEQVSNLNQLIRRLRNAITHYDIKFIGDANNKINLLTVWNTEPRTGQKTWEAILSISDLRKIVYMFSDLLINFKEVE
jgi:HEPN pEK499 p136